MIDSQITGTVKQKDGDLCEICIDASQLDYFVTFKCLFGKKRVLFGANQQHVNIKLNAQDALNLQSAIESYNPVYLHSDMTAVVKHIFFAERLWVNEAYISYVKRKSFLFNKFEVVSVAIPDIAFFNVSVDFMALNKRIYFGYMDQIDIQAPNGEFTNELERYIKSHGAKLGKEICSEYKSSFRWSKFYIPTYWFTREYISFNEEAMLYHRKTFFTQDTMYLPFSKISVILSSKGWLRKRIIVLGEMIVETKQPFNKKVVDTIMTEVRSHGIQSIISGSTFSPSKLWFRWLKTWIIKDVTAIVGDENIYVQPGKMGGIYRGISGFEPNDTEGFKSAEDKRCKEFSIVRKGSVTKAEFEKKHFWNITGVVNIVFNETSIRKDQQDIQSYGCISIDHIRRSDATDLISMIQK